MKGGLPKCYAETGVYCLPIYSRAETNLMIGSLHVFEKFITQFNKLSFTKKFRRFVISKFVKLSDELINTFVGSFFRMPVPYQYSALRALDNDPNEDVIDPENIFFDHF